MLTELPEQFINRIRISLRRSLLTGLRPWRFRTHNFKRTRLSSSWEHPGRTRWGTPEGGHFRKGIAVEIRPLRHARGMKW